ncbi:MAG: redoxin domain-containing protein [Candidatus Omnitrophica bacterium]|nr:redoxin domain-containing protein [Candidatus Omnitrophota bacterium]
MIKMKKGWVLFFAVVSFVCFIFLPPAGAKSPGKKLKKAPAFPVEGIWLNQKTSSKDIFKHKITLVYFWDYTSINCLRELEHLNEWYKLYHPYGLEMILVHSPEYQFAAEKENVAKALERFQMPYPVYLDNDFKMWDAYGMISWPTKLLVNEKGMIVHTQVGEGYHSVTEGFIRKHLKKFNPGAVLPEPLAQDLGSENYDAELCGPMGSETYLGYRQPSWWSGELANSERRFPDQTLHYKDEGERVPHGFFAHGHWTNRADYFEHSRSTDVLSDYLGIVYSAHEVYAVLNRIEDKPGGEEGRRVYVTRDDEPLPLAYRGPDILEDEKGDTYIMVREPKLYYLVAGEDKEFHELKLWPQQKGIAINSFSFSNFCLSDFEHR